MLTAFVERALAGTIVDANRYHDPAQGSYGCLVGYEPVMKRPKQIPPWENRSFNRFLHRLRYLFKEEMRGFYPGCGSWEPDKPFDAVLSYVLFQFCSTNRVEQLMTSKVHTTEDCLYIFAEKASYSKGKKAEWQRRERKKDQWKGQFFSPEVLERKRNTVLATMENSQVSREVFEYALQQCFQHAVTINNTGNFYGYVACDDPEKLGEYLSHLPVLHHEFSEEEMPQLVCGDPNLITIPKMIYA